MAIKATAADQRAVTYFNVHNPIGTPVTVDVEPDVHIPLKCKDHDAAGVPRNDCTEPGSMPRCMLCPISPTYWRSQEEGSITRGRP